MILGLVYLQLLAITLINCQEPKLLLVTIATDSSHDGFRRLEQSLKVLNYDYEVFGLGEEWRGGDMKSSTGGGQKINTMKRGLDKYKEDEDLIIIFTDAYDVIALEPPEVVIKKFQKTGARVLFGAESACWPNKNLADYYPKVEENEDRFLNSGLYMGYATDLYNIMTFVEIDDQYDDQLYFTDVFLNQAARNAYKMQLDTRSEVFFNINMSWDKIKQEKTVGEDGKVEWDRISKSTTGTHPSFLHANGPIFTKLELNRIGNYIGYTYDPEHCTLCPDRRIKLSTDQSTWPDVTIGVFIDMPVPFLREFFDKLAAIEYPKDKITLLIYNNVPMHNELVEAFFLKPENEYLFIKYIGPEDDYSEQDARNEAMKECMKNNCSYYLLMTSIVHVDNPKTLQILIEENREVLSPLMRKPGQMWANMWGAIDVNGYYKRSPDYLDIINRVYTGVFNVPYVGEIILHKGSALPKIDLVYNTAMFEVNIQYASLLREKDIFMYTTNLHEFGHIIEQENFNPKLVRPEMFEIFHNFQDWIDRYVHPSYADFFSNSSLIQEPCNDVFWFPLVSEEFCDDLIVMMEDFGEWSGGRNSYYDKRLEGGKENVPTVDIHMKQVGWQKHWLHFLETFVMPMQRKIFPGYWDSPPRAPLSFVVRYRVGEQEFLRPHNDASMYTINIALNRPNIDFHGGGCRFVRRNCSVQSTRKGWVTLHPGRLTHLHEGLRITNGTRYIMVSFIDP